MRPTTPRGDGRAPDPALDLFRDLPPVAVERDEIEAMKLAVASMRRTRPLARRRRGPWLRAAAVAAVLLGALLLRGAGILPEAVPAAPDGAPVAAEAAWIEPARALGAADVSLLPLVDGIDTPYVQLHSERLAVVMVTVENLDV